MSNFFSLSLSLCSYNKYNHIHIYTSNLPNQIPSAHKSGTEITHESQCTALYCYCIVLKEHTRLHLKNESSFFSSPPTLLLVIKNNYGDDQRRSSLFRLGLDTYSTASCSTVGQSTRGSYCTCTGKRGGGGGKCCIYTTSSTLQYGTDSNEFVSLALHCILVYCTVPIVLSCLLSDMDNRQKHMHTHITVEKHSTSRRNKVQ